MTEYVAFLRAVNVGPNQVRMARLRELFEELGLEGVETIINSGNVRFVAGDEDRDALEARIEAHLVEQLGWQVDTFIRTLPELAEIAETKPWGDQPADDHKVSVAFARRPFTTTERAALAEIQTDGDRFEAVGRELYWWRHGRISDSEVKPAVMNKAVAQPSTSRNIATVHRLLAKYGEG